MSHFTVLVVGEKPEDQLAPYHEFECTGEDNEFVVEVDETAEAKKEYAKGKVTRFKDAAGKLHEPYQDKFYRDPTPEEIKEIGPIGGTGCAKGFAYTSKDWGDGKGHRAKIHFTPKGFKKVEVPRKDVVSFAEFVDDYYGRKPVEFGDKPDFAEDHKYGYALLDKKGAVTKIVRRTNPNAKWDWYVLGGRWRGFFRLRKEKEGMVGRPGVPEMMSGVRQLPEAVADMAYKRDIDFDAMRKEAADEARARHQKLCRLLGVAEIKPPKLKWKAVCDGESIKDWDKKRKLYHDQPEMKAVEEARKSAKDDDRSFLAFLDYEDYAVPVEQYVEGARDAALLTHAVVKDGKWYEKGEMGWWAVVHDEKEEDAWNKEFSKLLVECPGDTLLSVWDCHI